MRLHTRVIKSVIVFNVFSRHYYLFIDISQQVLDKKYYQIQFSKNFYILFLQILYMIQQTPIDQFLNILNLQKYTQTMKKYGVQTMEDILILTPNDWQVIQILPFHRNKMIHSAATMKDKKFEHFMSTKISSSVHQYTFTCSGVYNNLKAESLKNFDPQGFGVTNTNESFMKFSFAKPVSVYGVIIGSNHGVTGGWNNTYLQGVQVQVKQAGSQEYLTVHTIKGMPNAENTAYLAKIASTFVEEVRLFKNSWFSTSYIHFV